MTRRHPAVSASPTTPTVPLFRVLWAHLVRSRGDALNYALAELANPKAGARWRMKIADLMIAAGGNATMMEAHAARFSPTLALVIRGAANTPAATLRRAPTAEECYLLMQSGFRVANLKPVPEPKKTSLWMQILEPAGGSGGSSGSDRQENPT